MGFQEVLSLGLIVGHMLASAFGPPRERDSETITARRLFPLLRRALTGDRPKVTSFIIFFITARAEEKGTDETSLRTCKLTLAIEPPLDCKALKANPLTVNSQDLWLAKDNRFLNPKISYERILMPM